MPKLPDPPSIDALRALGPSLVRVDRGTPLARVYFRGGPHPSTWNAFRYFGPTNARFDHHLPDPTGEPCLQARGILYAAGSMAPGALAVCLAEVFQQTRAIDTRSREPWFVVFDLARDITLLDLRGLWTTRAGASSAIASGPKLRARRWSANIFEAFPQIDGLIYASSMGGNADALALYERARDALPIDPQLNRGLADPLLRKPVNIAAEAIGYVLD